MSVESCVRYPDGMYRCIVETYDGTKYTLCSEGTPYEEVKELSTLSPTVWYTFTADLGTGYGSVALKVEDIKSITWPQSDEDEDEEEGCIDPRCDIGRTYPEPVDTDEE